MPLGGPDGWDYLAFDGGRVFIAHDSEVTVVDRDGAVAGRVAGLSNAHGIAFVSGRRQGYVTNGGGVTVFDLDRLNALGRIETGAGADAVLYDPASDKIFVMNGKARTITAIDAGSRRVSGTLPLPGKPEFGAVDGTGALFVNVETTAEILRIDTRSLQITARWAMPGCQSPHGLALDFPGHRLYSGCANSRLAVVETAGGGVEALLPAGPNSDAVAIDPRRRIAYSSNADGTLSRTDIGGDGIPRPLAPQATPAGARRMTLDPDSGRLYLVFGQNGATPGEIHPGGLSLLILDPR
ncbi:MAG: YncE family protein [Telmatospirillum sp.]|nr:YncE family protein [Telmatospirillum sp.]